MPLTTESTSFSADVLGRYTCNTFEEALVTHDPAARAAAGLPDRSDLRPFDFVVIGGGTFGAAIAEHLWFRSAKRSERILVLEGGPFLLPEHIQNLPVLGLGVADPSTVADYAAMSEEARRQWRKEVWGLAWNSAVKFPGLSYCIGGRSLYWGGWSPRLLPSELPKDAWPKRMLDDLQAMKLPDGRKGYFRQASDQIGVTQTNDFIFGALHKALRKQLMQGLPGIPGVMALSSLPDHPWVEYRDTPPTAAEMGQLLGFSSLPTPAPSLQSLKNEAKLEAPLAVQGQAGHAGFFPFNKFSTAPLLIKAARQAAAESHFDDIRKRLMVVPKCHVVRLKTVDHMAGQRVDTIVTERGSLRLPNDAKVIIALGTIESARLALASFPPDGKMGMNLIAHLRSNLDIRLPRTALSSLSASVQALECAALFVKGQHAFTKPDGSSDGVGHFHFQITASGLGANGTDSEAELFKKVPDIDTFDAHLHATDSQVVVTIRGIGEMEPKTDTDFSNSVTLDANPGQVDEFSARRAYVNLRPSHRDQILWDAMDRAADQIAKVFANGKKIDVIKSGRLIASKVDASALADILPYKVSDASGPGRRDGIGTTHHEAGTLRCGEDPSKSVTNPDCRFHRIANAFVAGPAVFPTIGSPNPMLSGIALLRRLGDHLIPEPPLAAAEAGFTYLFDGSEAQFENWQMAGPGNFVRVRRSLVAQQDGRGIGLLFYKQSTFENFILRVDFLLPHPRGVNNDNSGIFIRFRDPRLPDPAPVAGDPPDNAAFVAVHTGFEVQI